MIPVGDSDDRPDYDYSAGVTLPLYELEKDARHQMKIPSTQGKVETTFDIQRQPNLIRIRRQGTTEAGKMYLVDIRSPHPPSPSPQEWRGGDPPQGGIPNANYLTCWGSAYHVYMKLVVK